MDTCVGRGRPPSSTTVAAAAGAGVSAPSASSPAPAASVAAELRIAALLVTGRRVGLTADLVLGMTLLNRRLLAGIAGLENVTDEEWTALAQVLRAEDATP